MEQRGCVCVADPRVGEGGAFSLEALPASAAAPAATATAAVRPTMQEAARNRGALGARAAIRGEACCAGSRAGPGTPPGTHPVSGGGAVGGRRLPAPRGPPRAPPTAHLPRPASRARRPRRSVPPLPRSVPRLPRSAPGGSAPWVSATRRTSAPALQAGWSPGWLGGLRAGWGPGLPRGGPCSSRVDAGLCTRGWLQLPCPRPCPLAQAPQPPRRKGISLEGAKLMVRDGQRGTEVAPGLRKGMSSFRESEFGELG